MKPSTIKIDSIANCDVVLLSASEIASILSNPTTEAPIPKGLSPLVRGRYNEALSAKRKPEIKKLRFKWQKSIANFNLHISSGQWVKVLKSPTNSLYDYLSNPQL